MRPGEEIDTNRLASWLGAGPIEVEQFLGGHSNLTYLIRTLDSEYVLRRPPIGPVPPKAHDMAREYRVLERIQPFFPVAPKVYRLCDDSSVIGAPFFLMERRIGFVPRNGCPVDATQVSRAFMDCFVALHAVDVQSTGLISLGKPDGFLQRQVHGWADRWRRAKTDDAPDAEPLISFLANNIPDPLPCTIVHNDFKLDNLMLDPADHQRVTAVLDWEMTTVGDPLVDVGLSLCYWTSGRAGGPDLSLPGWYTRDEFIREYASRTGRDLSNIRWYEILGIFKLAVILQQIYGRWKAGQTRDVRFSTLIGDVRTLLDHAGDCKRNIYNSAETFPSGLR